MKCSLFRLTCIASVSLATCSAYAAKSVPTFAGDVAQIMFDKCASCHRPGQSGPFSLLTYDDVSDRAETIAAVIADGYMPPWKLVTEDVPYAHDRRLSASQTATINKWVKAGSPEGDPARTPRLPEFPRDWQLGTPDIVVEMEGQFSVPADGPDLYRSFLFKLQLPEDKWVKAVEIKPQAKSTLHHALFFLDTSGEARRRDGRDGQAGMSGMSFLLKNQGREQSAGTGGISSRGLGGYVPGTTPAKLPGDLAMLLPKGADIVMQTHFHPSGRRETAHATLALYLADKPPSRQLAGIQLPPNFGRFAGINVAPGDTDFEIADSFIIPVDVEGIAIGGHAHYICREMHFDATLPNGKTISLMQIDDWDLDWQDSYQFARSIDLPAGTEVHSRIVYDNSADNPENPFDPPQRIKWGRESTDEMGSITLTVVAKNAADHRTLQRAIRSRGRGNAGSAIGNAIADRLRGLGNGQALIRQLDKNEDGKIQRSELPARVKGQLFDRIDTNSDGVVDQAELERARIYLQKRQ